MRTSRSISFPVTNASTTICVDIVTMTRMACSSRSGSQRTTSISPTTPSCRTLSTAGGGSEATTLTPRSHNYGVEINPTITPSEQPFRRRYNFRKANWESFTTTLDNGITSLASPSWKAYKSFSDLVRVCTRKCIPRGCRTKYISGLTPEPGELLLLSYPSHHFSHLRAHAVARSVTVARSSAVQASSSRRQERRWAIVCGSPQSQSTNWASSR